MRNDSSKGIRFYLLWATACILTGWTLSALRWLTLTGYAVMLPLVMIGLVWLTRNPADMTPPRVQRRWGRAMFRRFRRPLPLIYLVVLVLVFVGTISHAPSNYDGLTYRLPRMLNWLTTRGWTWIFTSNERMNYSGTGWEWMALPLLALRSDRALFLINTVGFLLLPGLIFSVFRQVGVARRAAWAWMWILSTAYGYVQQAGSIGNDLTGTFFCLISVHYGLRARRNGRVEEVWLAGLAAAIMTGIKTSNLPLLLPCLLAAGPALKLLRRCWTAGILIGVIALVVSAIPTVGLNQKYTGNWTGDPDDSTQMHIRDPIAGFLGSSILLGQQLLMPPFLPGVPNVNVWLNHHLPDTWKHKLEKGFPRFTMNRLNELPQEEGASLGIGITLLLLAAGVAPWCRAGKKNQSTETRRWKISSVGLATWGASLLFMLKIGSEANARLMLPYYPLVMIPVLILPGQDCLVRRAGWRILAVLVSLSVLPCLILTPSRPFWPTQAVSEWLVRHYPESALMQRMETVYSCYQHRNDLLAPLRVHLPDDVTKVGFIAGDNNTDYSLWRPFGHRQVVYLWNGTPQSFLLPPDVEWIVVKQNIWPKVSPVPLEEWAAQHGIEIAFSVPIQSFASGTEETWCLLHIRKP
jgi:hypothetical protein